MAGMTGITRDDWDGWVFQPDVGRMG